MNNMSEYNLTIGQAIDEVLKGNRVEINSEKNAYLALDTKGYLCWYKKVGNNYTSDLVIRDVSRGRFRLYNAEPKMIKMYRAKVYITNIGLVLTGTDFYQEKKDFYDTHKGVTVLNDEWEEIEVPEDMVYVIS